jgi:hypothetical protein
MMDNDLHLGVFKLCCTRKETDGAACHYGTSCVRTASSGVRRRRRSSGSPRPIMPLCWKVMMRNVAKGLGLKWSDQEEPCTRVPRGALQLCPACAVVSCEPRHCLELSAWGASILRHPRYPLARSISSSMPCRQLRGGHTTTVSFQMKSLGLVPFRKFVWRKNSPSQTGWPSHFATFDIVRREPVDYRGNALPAGLSVPSHLGV